MYDYILVFILNVAVVWVVIQNEDILRIGICPMGMQHLVMFAVDSVYVPTSTILIYWYNLTTTHLECFIQDNYTDDEFCSAWFSSGGVDAKRLATDWVNFPTHLMQCSVTDIILQ
jgi:hypothetical protein